MTRAKLMIPGPVDIDDTVRESMAVPSMPHYGQAWIRLHGETQEMLKRVFGTRHDLYIMPGTGTMALEAGMTSALEPGDTILIPTNGFFADRLVTIAKSCALHVIEVTAPLGQPVTADVVATALDEHPEIKAVALVHHETSTGVLNPLREIAEVAHAREVLLIVDAVSSLGGVPLPVDDWDIDFCVSVGNKTLETPPALTFISISPRAWEAVDRREAPRGWYLDLKTWRWYAKNWGDWHPSPVTMPTSNLYALHQSLQLLLADGLENRYAAYKTASVAVRQGLRALGFTMFVEDSAASPLTTAFCMRPGVDADALKVWLAKEAKVMISGGIGELRGKILRIGHIGQSRKRDYVLAFLLGVEDYLRSQGEPIRAGESLIALEALEI